MSNRVPDKEKAKGRNIALPDVLFDRLKKESKKTDQSISSIIREALELRWAGR